MGWVISLMVWLPMSRPPCCPTRTWESPTRRRMAQARRAIALKAVGCYIHMGLGMSEGVAVQRGVDIGPPVVDLYLAV